MLKQIKNGLIFGITAGISMLLIVVTYAAWTSLGTVSNNQPLTADFMNNLIGNVEYNNSQLLGVDQSRQEMELIDTTSSNYRKQGLEYNNNTGKPIYIVVREGGIGTSIYLLVDGNIIDAGDKGSGVAGNVSVSGIIPNGSSYQVNAEGLIQGWKELR